MKMSPAKQMWRNFLSSLTNTVTGLLLGFFGVDLVQIVYGGATIPPARAKMAVITVLLVAAITLVRCAVYETNLKLLREEQETSDILESLDKKLHRVEAANEALHSIHSTRPD